MAERRHGGRRSDARGGGRGEGRGDLLNEEAARQRDLRDIENDDLRQQVRDLQRDIENGDLRQQVRDLQRRLARLEKRRGKSNPMRSNASERRSVDDPLFNDVYGGQSKPVYDKDILSMPVYDEPVYDEDIFSIPVYDKPVYDEDILSMPVYDKPVYDEDIFYELPGLMSKSPPPSVRFDDAAEDESFVHHLATAADLLAAAALRAEEVMDRVGNAAAIAIAATEFFNGDASESLEDVSSGRYSNHSHGRGVSFGGDDMSLELIHLDALTELKVIADRMIRSGYEKECCQVYCSVQRDVLEECMSILGVEKLSIEEVQKFDWKSLDDKMKKWLQAVKIVVRGLLSSEKHLCEQILNGLRCYFDNADSRTDSRTSLFQEGEYDVVLEDMTWWLRKLYDVVLEDMTWWLRKLYFRFYLFPS